MNINSITIEKVKGIDQRTYNLNLLPNKPNILVAPNGFGKSSFAIAFESLKSNKIELDEKNFYLKNPDNIPSISITLSTGQTLLADNTQNNINDIFDIFVINNQTEPRSILQSFGGRSFAKPSLEISPTVLINSIPPKVDFYYNSAEVKKAFGVNGNRILANISNLFANASLLEKISNEIDFSRFNLKSFIKVIDETITRINEQQGSGLDLKLWIASNILPSVMHLDELVKLMDIISSFRFVNANQPVDVFLASWQLLFVKNKMGTDFKKACKYLSYKRDKEYFSETITNFNPVSDRFNIKPKEENGSLVVRWPKAHEISNGQRDILTFMALLLKARRNFKKKDCLLIIDEIFDYMDDANLITFQYYISSFIDRMKRQKRRIFPILLTHLDPLFFNHFCFNDSKIKVCYLKETSAKSSKKLLDLVYKRSDVSIQKNVDKYYFHFHPTLDGIDLSSEFSLLGLNTDWATPAIFLKKINREIRRYLYEDSIFDPLAVCFGVRIQVEKIIYERITSSAGKSHFLENVNGTKNKLLYAQNIGVDIPETFFLLGIIYNNSLHLSPGTDISQPLGLKLENLTIKKMIEKIFSGA